MNRASQIPSTLAGGPIARGAAFSIRGVHFGSAATVSLRNGTVVTPVKVLAVQPERIEALMPDASPLGPSTLVVTAEGRASKPFSIEVAASNPGVFSQNNLGWGPGRIENIDSLGKKALNSATHPATPGQRVTMIVTGLGKSAPAIVVVGNRTANAGVARAGAQPGEQEISFAVPPDTPQGCYVPVYLQASPNRASNVVTMTVQAAVKPGGCDSGPIPILETKRIGMVIVSRTNMDENGKKTDKGEVAATFTLRDPGLSRSPLMMWPPPGTCTTYTSALQWTTNPPISLSASLSGELGGEGLAAGPQVVVGRDNRRRSIPWDPGSVGYYHAKVPLRFLNPGKFFLSGPGGIDVGRFRVTTEAPGPFEWTDRDQTAIVNRTRSLPLHWRGQAAGRWTVVIATNIDQTTTAIGTCLCTTPSNATHFEIPAALLANIPASSGVGYPYDRVFVVSIPAKATPIPAAGIGMGALFSIYANGRTVQFH
ncbi:MAG TPA: hypothetical protein VK752_26215 [Bryobacteraceae bacterium]|nr:hypothetical protein [Bryobacteraceae bacterium]